MGITTGRIIFNKSKDTIKEEQGKKFIKQQEEEEKNKDKEKQADQEGSETKQESKEKLEGLVSQSNRLLLKTSSIFPFDLFPDELVIDASKIDIIYHDIFGFSTTHTIPIGDIVDVSVGKIPFFATLKIIDKRYMESQEFAVKFLKIDEADRARRLIQGLIAAKEQGIDLSEIANDEDLVKKLEKLGQIKG